MTDVHPNSKPDTVLLLDPDLADPWTDHSQSRVSLIDQGTYLDESPSVRTAINSPREITLVWDIRAGESGILIRHGDAASYSYRVQLDGSDNVLFHENGSMLARVSLPDIQAGSDNTFLISWTQHDFGSSVRSEFFVSNLTQGTFDGAQVTHTATNTNATHTLTVGAGFGGASTFSDPLDFRYVRIGRRHHSITEQREDWIAQTTPPAMTQTRRAPPLITDRSTLTSLAADGDFVGPGLLWAGHAFEQADRRLVGSILNQRITNPIIIKSSYDMPITGWWTTAPGDSTVNLCTSMLWRRPVPRKVSRGYVRVWLHQNNNSASSVAEARVRVYSMSGLPTADAPAGSIKWHRTAQVTRQTDDGAGLSLGALATPGALDLAVDDDGFTWLAVGVSFGAHAQLANTELYIHLVTIDPYHEPGAAASLGAEDP